jgi:hypothetical protein
MIPEMGEDVKDVYEHWLRENGVSHAQTMRNKSVSYLQPQWCIDHLCQTHFSGGEHMVTDELEPPCSFGSRKEKK